VRSQTFRVPHQTVRPDGFALHGTIPSVKAGASSCKGVKSSFESSLFSLAVPLRILGTVACRSLGRWGLFSKLSLGYLGQPAKENFSFSSAKFGSLIHGALGEKGHVYVTKES